MDKLLYIASQGANQNMNSLALRANNLANATTTGFKADLEQARAIQAYGNGMPTRVFSMTEKPSHNFESGMMKLTGRDLDLAIEGDGWFVVQDKDGQEALTRNGNLTVSASGILQNMSGQNIVGQSGQPIVLPMPVQKMEISKDGIISVLPMDAPPDAMEEIDQIKLVNPNMKNLAKGTDGLFRGNVANMEIDPNVQVMKGALENSNVNPINEMVHMISLQRQFETQIKMMKTAEETDQSNSALLKS